MLYSNIIDYETVGTLDWDFGSNNDNLNNNLTRKVWWRNTTTSYGCESELTRNYFCDAFNALDYSQSCANVTFSAYNVKECENYTIIGYNVSYFEELMCCESDMCNYNFTKPKNPNGNTTAPDPSDLIEYNWYVFLFFLFVLFLCFAI